MERISLRHSMRKAAQTYRWKCEKPSASACRKQNNVAASYNKALTDIKRWQATQASELILLHTVKWTRFAAVQQYFSRLQFMQRLYCIIFYCKGLTVLDLVGVPETYSATKWQLSHQQIVHPPKSKLQVLHLILLEMIVNVLWRQNTHKNTHRG